MPICYLEDLFVDPEVRGLGVGQALIADLLKLGTERGWSRIYWHTRSGNTARKLHDRFTAADDFVRYQLVLSQANAFLAGLAGDRIRDLGPAVADVDAIQAAKPINDFFTVDLQPDTSATRYDSGLAKTVIRKVAQLSEGMERRRSIDGTQDIRTRGHNPPLRMGRIVNRLRGIEVADAGIFLLREL
jgi:hypothetical protein